MLGATIHDVAQVVGAGYAVSDLAGNTAVIVKLFRVFLLLPVVLAVGWWFAERRGGARRQGAGAGVRLRVPGAVHRQQRAAVAAAPSRRSTPQVKAVLVEASTDGLLIAIGALGLGTSVSAIGMLGWRHIATVGATTLVILVVATGRPHAACAEVPRWRR